MKPISAMSIEEGNKLVNDDIDTRSTKLIGAGSPDCNFPITLNRNWERVKYDTVIPNMITNTADGKYFNDLYLFLKCLSVIRIMTQSEDKQRDGRWMRDILRIRFKNIIANGPSSSGIFNNAFI